MSRTKDTSLLVCLKFLKIASTIHFDVFMIFVTYLMFNHDITLLRFYFTSYGCVFYLIIKVSVVTDVLGAGVLVGKFAISFF